MVMATGADVRDILELAGGENDGPISKKDLINSDKVTVNDPRLCITIFTATSFPFNTYSESCTGNEKHKMKPQQNEEYASVLCLTVLPHSYLR